MLLSLGTSATIIIDLQHIPYVVNSLSNFDLNSFHYKIAVINTIYRLYNTRTVPETDLY